MLVSTSCKYMLLNRPRSIYQYSNMAPRLSVKISIFGVVFFVSKAFLGICSKYAVLHNYNVYGLQHLIR